MIGKTFVLEVPGVPVAKGRPRMTKSGIAYTPMKTRNYEADLRVLAKQKMRGRQPMTGPLRVDVVAYLPTPTSWPKWKRETTVRHTGRPDIDNLGKIIDGLNGVVWKDDAQIDELCIRKQYSDQPRLVIQVHHDPQAVHSKTSKRPSGKVTADA